MIAGRMPDLFSGYRREWFPGMKSQKSPPAVSGNQESPATLEGGALGLTESVVMGVAGTAPAFSIWTHNAG